MASDGAWAAGQGGAELGKLDLNLPITANVSLSRAYRSELATLKNAPLSAGVHEVTTDTLKLGLGARTQFAFSRQIDTTQDLLARLHSGTETNRLSFAQGFGGGPSTGTVSLERAWTTRTDGTTSRHEVVDALALTTGLGRGLDLTSKFTNATTDDPRGENRQAWEAALGFEMSGGKGLLAFDSTDAVRGSTRTGATGWRLSTPFAAFGGKAAFAYSQKDSYVNDFHSLDQLVSLSTPLPGGLAFSGKYHTVRPSAASGLDLTDQLLSLDAPWFFGQKLHFDSQRLTQLKPGANQSLFVDNLTIPLGFVAGKGLMEYHAKDQVTNGQATYSRLARIQTPLPFVGAASNFAYSEKRDLNPKEGESYERLLEIFVPVTLLGDTTRLDYRGVTSLKAKNWQRQSLFTLAMPLTAWRQGASFTQTFERLSTGGPMGTVMSTTLIAPWSAFGTTGGLRQQYITSDLSGTFKTDWITALTAKVNRQDLSLTRQLVETRTASGVQHRTMTALTTPAFDLFTPQATISGSRVEVTDTAAPDTTRTILNVEAQPLPLVKLAARMEQNTAEPGVDVMTQSLLARVALGKGLSLQGRVELRDQSDLPSLVQVQQVQLATEKSGPLGLGLLVSYASWDAPGEANTGAGEVQLTAGDPLKNVGVTAQLTEYDAAKLKTTQDPLVKVSIAHGVPDGFNVKLDYADQQGRPAPESAVALAMPALGGSLQVGYGQNPLARDGKTVVLLTERYDASLSRSFGGVDVQLGYRTYSGGTLPGVMADTDCLMLKVAGGQEERGGKIALDYQEGDFVPQPDLKKRIPTSILDLSYARRWGDEGRLVLTLRRNTVPEDAPELVASMEGRLEFKTVW